jgi:hypothetical protein
MALYSGAQRGVGTLGGCQVGWVELGWRVSCHGRRSRALLQRMVLILYTRLQSTVYLVSGFGGAFSNDTCLKFLVIYF